MKDFYKKTWRFLRQTLALIGALIIVALIIESVDNDWRWRNRYHMRNYTEELPYGCCKVVKHGRMRITDAHGKTIIRRVDDITPQDSMAVVVKNHKRGYINLKQGRLAVEPQYEHAWLFGCGIGAVMKDKKLGFIDGEGRIVIPFRYPYYGTGIYDYVFKAGHCAVADPVTGKKGIINMKGEWVFLPEYDKAIARKEGAEVYRKGGWKQLYAYDGTLIYDRMIDGIYYLDFPIGTHDPQTGKFGHSLFFLDGLRTYRVYGYEGLITSKGVFVTPPIYDEIEAISADLFRAKLSSDGSRILIDANGKEVK